MTVANAIVGIGVILRILHAEKRRDVTTLKSLEKLSDIDKGYLSLSISIIFILFTYAGLYQGGFFDRSQGQLLNFGEYSYRYLLEKYAFYGAIISAQIGYLFIYGDVEREFWKITLVSVALFFVMDLNAVFSLLGGYQ